MRMEKEHLFPLIVLLIVTSKLVSSAPKSWPYMKTYDIWSSNESNNGQHKNIIINNNTIDDNYKQTSSSLEISSDNIFDYNNNKVYSVGRKSLRANGRKAKGENH
jgi:hypothetical protein